MMRSSLSLDDYSTTRGRGLSRAVRGMRADLRDEPGLPSGCIGTGILQGLQEGPEGCIGSSWAGPRRDLRPVVTTRLERHLSVRHSSAFHCAVVRCLNRRSATAYHGAFCCFRALSAYSGSIGYRDPRLLELELYGSPSGVSGQFWDRDKLGGWCSMRSDSRGRAPPRRLGKDGPNDQETAPREPQRKARH